MMMKIHCVSIIALNVLLRTSNGFVVVPVINNKPTSRHFLPRAAVALEEEVAVEIADPYSKIGVAEEQLALGANPEEFLKYIGTREDLIAKTLEDIPAFDRTKAEQEVDKFLLDLEAIDLYIQLEKRKEEDPDFVVPSTNQEDEGLFSFRNFVIAYLVWVASTTIPNVFRKWVAQKEAAGEWQGTNIPFIDDWIANTAVTASETVQAVSVSDMAAQTQQASDALQAVADVVVQATSAGVQ